MKITYNLRDSVKSTRFYIDGIEAGIIDFDHQIIYLKQLFNNTPFIEITEGLAWFECDKCHCDLDESFKNFKEFSFELADEDEEEEEG